MNEQVKVFSHVTGKGGTLIESPLEDNINEWLSNSGGQVLRVTQSESERAGVAHITICIWYVPGSAAPTKS
jgi:hypothetical protein